MCESGLVQHLTSFSVYKRNTRWSFIWDFTDLNSSSIYVPTTEQNTFCCSLEGVFFFFFIPVCILEICFSLTNSGSSLSRLCGVKSRLLAGPSRDRSLLLSLACFIAFALRLLMWSILYKGTLAWGGIVSGMGSLASSRVSPSEGEAKRNTTGTELLQWLLWECEIQPSTPEINKQGKCLVTGFQCLCQTPVFSSWI